MLIISKKRKWLMTTVVVVVLTAIGMMSTIPSYATDSANMNTETSEIILPSAEMSEKEVDDMIAKATVEAESSMDFDQTEIEELVKESKQASTTETDDGQYVDDMYLEANAALREVEALAEEAIGNGEKTYSLKEILQASSSDLGITDAQMIEIKEDVLSYYATINTLEDAVADIEDGYIVTESIDYVRNDFRIPATMISFDPAYEELDGHISALAGWPGCVDNNGWGYQNFIASDCFYALTIWGVCILDSTIGKAMQSARYCRYNVNNCSWTIGHSKYAHKH